jgi:hypothetical protein
VYRAAADAIVVLHLAFVFFVVGGGLLALRWPSLAWVHVPAAVWGAVVEFAGWICPLTPLENALRARGGETAYHTDFVERYVLPLLYPSDLTREVQVVVGGIVIALNLGIYGLVWRRSRRASTT